MLEDRNREYVAYAAENQRAYDALRNDAVLGGTNFEATTANVNRAFGFGVSPDVSERLRGKLRAAGLDNDRDIAEWANAIGRARAEDRPTIVPVGEPEKVKDTREVLFPSSAKAAS